MSRIAYLDGAYLPLEEARVSILDRGFVFGDGIYEVAGVLGGGLVDNAGHLARFDRCLKAIDIRLPFPIETFTDIAHELVARNRLDEGLVYFQVTRGVAERAFAMASDPPPTIVGFTQEKTIRDSPAAETGLALKSVPDLRWKLRDVKSISLLAQVIATREAAAAGADEALMIEDGLVTEGGSSSVMIVDAEGSIRARPLGDGILPGITRQSLATLCAEESIPFVERAFTLEEAKAARECFLTSASKFVTPVTRIDDAPVGDGTPGPLTRRLREIYFAFAERTAVHAPAGAAAAG